MSAIQSFGHLQTFQYLGAPDSTLGDFRQYLIDQLGHDQWLSEQQLSNAFSDYREKIMECAPRMKKAVKHCTLYVSVRPSHL